jgi:hypothetical protein
MRAVNLLPQESRPGGPPVLTPTSVAVGGASLFVIVALVFGVLFVHEHNRAAHRDHVLASIEAQVTAVQAETARRAAAASSKSADPNRVTAFDTASSDRVSWDNLLDDISRVLPAGTWLSNLTMQSGTSATTGTTAAPTTTATPAAPATPATTPTPTAFVVTGVAFSQDLVAQVMRRLALIPQLSDVTLQTSSRADIGTTKAFQFTLSANVNPPLEVAR